jgi:hypothetical protein
VSLEKPSSYINFLMPQLSHTTFVWGISHTITKIILSSMCLESSAPYQHKCHVNSQNAWEVPKICWKFKTCKTIIELPRHRIIYESMVDVGGHLYSPRLGSQVASSGYKSFFYIGTSSIVHWHN